MSWLLRHGFGLRIVNHSPHADNWKKGIKMVKYTVHKKSFPSK